MNYKTVEKSASDEYVEKKSRFIGYAKPVNNEDEAVNFINEIKAKHRDATHNVYAYVVRENNIQRYSDDGEPSGTAGVPVLEVIKKEGLTDVVLVVTRYFGGTMLGAGGLVRAYSHSAKLGIVAANIVEMIYSIIFEVVIEYSLLGIVQYEISNFATVLNIDYSAVVTLMLCVEKDKSDELQKKIINATNAMATVNKVGERFVPIKT